jgi:hypothetical protein
MYFHPHPPFRNQWEHTMKRIKAESIVVAGILIWGTILRFYDWKRLPFTHDEYSTIFRTGYNSFAELISLGVQVDTMPAFLQVFVHYWIALFGASPIAVKLPFLLMGTASVFLMFRLGVIWNQRQTGLLAAATMATTQYAVMYSQIARPYISGLFFSLLLLIFWSRLIRGEKPPGFNYNTLGFVFAGALCAYNHHLNLLFLVVVGLSGLFYLKGQALYRYIIAGAGIFALYIPHLSIFFDQLSRGGVEDWLAKPTWGWILNYFFYLGHFSLIATSTYLVVILLPIFFRKETPLLSKTNILWAGLFTIPFLITFFYSLFVNAVLQFSGLIFGFPALLMLAFSTWKNAPTKVLYPTIVLILGINTFSLFYTRQHHQVFYQSAYEEILAGHEAAQLRNDATLSMIQLTPQIAAHLHKGPYPNTDYIDLNHLTPAGLDSLLQREAHRYHSAYLGLQGSANPAFVPVVRRFFPKISTQRNYFIGTTRTFEKGNRPAPFAEISDSGNLNTPYLSGFEIQLSKLIKHPNDEIDIVAKVLSNASIAEMVLVAELRDGEDKVHWQGTPVAPFQGDHEGYVYPVTTIKLADMPPPKEGIVLLAYLWNPAEESIPNYQLQGFHREGNPVLYGLIAPIRQPVNIVE